MEKNALGSIRKKMEFLEKHEDRLVIDADTHISPPGVNERLNKSHAGFLPGYYHGKPVTAGQLLEEMKASGVDMCLVWQNPSVVRYKDGDQNHNYDQLLKANRYIHESSFQHETRFIPAGWTDPRALGVDRAIELALHCIRTFGFPMVKMNPAQNAFMIDHEDVLRVVDAIVSAGAVPAFHYGSDTMYTPAHGLEKIAARYPESPVIAVHMGGGGASYTEAENQYHESRLLGLKHANLKFVLSSKRDTHMESDLVSYEMAGEPFRRNLFCASDAPYGNMSWNFGGFRAMLQALKSGHSCHDERLKKNPGLFSDESIRNYLGSNFARLASEAYDRMLANV